MVRPIVPELGQARRQRDARILQCLADAQAGVPAFVPANTLVRGDRGLEASEGSSDRGPGWRRWRSMRFMGSVILVNRIRGGAVGVTVSTSGQLSVVLEPTRAPSVHRLRGPALGGSACAARGRPAGGQNGSPPVVTGPVIGELRRWGSSCGGASPQLAAAVACASWVMCA